MFNVSSIVLVCSSINVSSVELLDLDSKLMYCKKDNVLDDDDLPSKVEVAYLAQHGCAITKAVPEIDQAWNYDEATTFLSKLFPTAMQYASRE